MVLRRSFEKDRPPRLLAAAEFQSVEVNTWCASLAVVTSTIPTCHVLPCLKRGVAQERPRYAARYVVDQQTGVGFFRDRELNNRCLGERIRRIPSQLELLRSTRRVDGDECAWKYEHCHRTAVVRQVAVVDLEPKITGPSGIDDEPDAIADEEWRIVSYAAE